MKYAEVSFLWEPLGSAHLTIR